MNHAALRLQCYIAIVASFFGLIIILKRRQARQWEDSWSRQLPFLVMIRWAFSNRRARGLLGLPRLPRRFWRTYEGCMGVWENVVLGAAAMHKEPDVTPKAVWLPCHCHDALRALQPHSTVATMSLS
jgi:hypothetical protein